MHYIGVFLIGIIIGFLGGLFGKGGSAAATPMLSLIGIPGIVLVKAPLLSTVPETFIASLQYWRNKLTFVVIGVGLTSVLLANSSVFLLAPSYARILTN